MVQRIYRKSSWELRTEAASDVFPQVSDKQPTEGQLPSEKGPTQAAQGENNLREGLENGTSSLHVNVIVKEEEEEEPLCGTATVSFGALMLNLPRVTLTPSFCFVLSKDDPPHAESGGQECSMPEPTEEQLPEISTEIKITVKEEEEELSNSKDFTSLSVKS